METERFLARRLTVTSVGVAALVLGVLAALLDHRDAVSGFELDGFLDGLYRGNGGTLLGIGFTVLILDRLYKRREDRERRAKLARALASPDRTAALTALETLRTEDWLADGALRGADLHDAQLARADLRGVNLRDADLAGADLTGAQLAKADLSGADLSGADLTGADLAGARLGGARLRGADLTRVNLRRAVVDEDGLGAAHAMLDATLADGRRYDGRFDLDGDRRLAERLGFAGEDRTAMARFYAIPLERYAAG